MVLSRGVTISGECLIPKSDGPAMVIFCELLPIAQIIYCLFIRWQFFKELSFLKVLYIYMCIVNIR